MTSGASEQTMVAMESSMTTEQRAFTTMTTTTTAEAFTTTAREFTTTAFTTTTSAITTTTPKELNNLVGRLTAGFHREATTHAPLVSVAELSSSMQHFGYIDYSVFVLMLVVCALIGFYYGFMEKKKPQKGQTNGDSEALNYLVGGRSMKVLPVSLSLVASFVSGISLLGTSTEVYVYGTRYAFIVTTLLISGIISWYIYLPVFCNLQLTSTYEYFERRFSRRIRLFGATLFTFKAIIWLPIAIYVPALTLNQVSGVDLHVITPIVIVICTFYTTVGGIKGVVFTDVVQSFVMFGSLIVLMVKGTYDLGGLQEVWRRNAEGGRLNFPELTFDPTVRLSVLSVFIGGTFFKIQSTAINQPTIQRFMSLPSLAKIKQTLITFSIGLVLLYLGCVYVGLVTYATYKDCDPISTGLAKARDQLVPVLVMRVLGVIPGLPGLFVSGVFSAALSSLSTLLNSLSAVILEDFVKPNVSKPLTQRQTAVIMRLVVIVFGTSSIGLVYLVEKLGMVLQLSATLQSILYGPMLGIFTAGMLMPWIKEKSVLFGSLASVLCMTWICVNAQIANVTGTFRHTKLPVSVEQCDYEFPENRLANSSAEFEEHAGSSIYHMSFLLYAMMGMSITLIGANLASLVYGLNDASSVDEKLLAPFVARWMARRRKEDYQCVLQKDELEMLNGKKMEKVDTFEER